MSNDGQSWYWVYWNTEYIGLGHTDTDPGPILPYSILNLANTCIRIKYGPPDPPLVSDAAAAAANSASGVVSINTESEAALKPSLTPFLDRGEKLRIDLWSSLYH